MNHTVASDKAKTKPGSEATKHTSLTLGSVSKRSLLPAQGEVH